MTAAVDTVPVRSPAQPAPQAKPNPIETLQKTVSASRLNTWLACRLKFFFPYVQQISKPKTASLHVGSVVHLILQAWNMARWRKQAFNRDHFKGLFEEGWKDQPPGINWDGEEAGEKNTAWSVLEMYFAQTPIKANEMPEAVEVPMESDLSKYGLPTLIGIVDLVRYGGKIVDFKTSGKTPDPEDAIHQNEAQLSCYSVLYRDATGHLESGRELHHLVKTKTPKLVITELPPMTDAQRVRLFRMLESYVEGVVREDFVPSPGFACAGCEFFNECRKWC
jgi:PD-(D/E)XK nuclease superfamily